MKSIQLTGLWRWTMTWWVLGVCVALIPTITLATEVRGEVVSIADGDTVSVLDVDNVQHTIRLAGIDAPERGQPFGQRSRQALADLVFRKQVVVEWSKLDRYGRKVGVVLINGTDACLAQVKAGLAWHYKKYQSEQTPSERLTYANAEEEARAARRGLWSDKEPEAPWDYRKRLRHDRPQN